MSYLDSTSASFPIKTLSAPKRKRSLLGFNRRKTSEVRLGSDGKMITNGYDDYKRPSSPIDKIKNLFRRDSANRETSNINTNDFYTRLVLKLL